MFPDSSFTNLKNSSEQVVDRKIYDCEPRKSVSKSVSQVSEDIVKSGSEFGISVKGTEFEDFNDMLKVTVEHHECCTRKKIDIGAGKLNEIVIPWPSKLMNWFNEFYRLEAVFVLFTPMITSHSTRVRCCIMDKRTATSDDGFTMVSSVTFPSREIVLFGLGLGTSIAKKDSHMIRLGMAVEEKIAKKGVVFATAECYFITSAANRACVSLNSALHPIVIPPESRALLKNFNNVVEYMKKTNGKTVKKTKEIDKVDKIFGKMASSTSSASSSHIMNALSERIEEEEKDNMFGVQIGQ